MIKNVAVKVFLQNAIFPLFSWWNLRTVHNKKKIMLYSNMGFRDNVKALYDYLIEERYNEKYMIICSTNDYKTFVKNAPKNVSFISNLRGILEYFSAGYVYYCFGKLPIFHGKDQKVVQMWHGSPYKKADDGMLRGHAFNKPYYSNCFSASKHFVPIWSSYFSIKEENIIVCGHPRCDALFKPCPNYDFGFYKKIILWAPTFRKSSITGYNDTKDESELVPVIKKTDYQKINAELKTLGVKVVVKLHPLQDLNDYKDVNMENFVLLSHQEFMGRDMDLYRFMAQCDALITDYSSIFYDYLLLDRPIGFTEEDMKDYADTRGFSVNNPSSYKPGYRINCSDDLLSFARDLVNDKDEYKAERDRVLNLSNDYRNGGFSKRALESIGVKL